MRISNKKKLFYRWIEKFFAVFTDKIICVSNFEKKSALDNHICSEKKLEVILNGIEIAEVEQKIANSKLTRNSLNIPENAYIVGMVGRISEQKAPDVFVKAARKIKDAIPDAFFIIVGDGPDQAEIEKMISDLGLKDSFLITGWVNNPIDYLALFDVAVLCSRWEGLPLVVPEYFAAKKPVVCTRIDAVDDMIENGVNGIVVDVDCAEKLALSVVSFVNNERNREMFIRNSYEKAKDFFDIRCEWSALENCLLKFDEK
jgi:glycosyltransferase involved in cell wall biosynthesis